MGPVAVQFPLEPPSCHPEQGNRSRAFCLGLTCPVECTAPPALLLSRSVCPGSCPVPCGDAIALRSGMET
eukprot:scaffold4851_cov428-Prasinococcus_capsulatus_cf.AAC.16